MQFLGNATKGQSRLSARDDALGPNMAPPPSRHPSPLVLLSRRRLGQDLGVQRLAREQFLVRAARDDATLVQQEHPTREGDRRDAVRDDDGGALLSGVRAGRRRCPTRRARRWRSWRRPRMRIGGLSKQRAGDGDALALAPREGVAALADDRVVALGQAHDELVARSRRAPPPRSPRVRRRADRRRCCRGSRSKRGTARRVRRRRSSRSDVERQVAHVVSVDRDRRLRSTS